MQIYQIKFDTKLENLGQLTLISSTITSTRRFIFFAFWYLKTWIFNHLKLTENSW